jgi:hypothetical protein
MTGPIERARAAWGEAMPEWVAVLARACAASSQAKVARRLGRSSALVSEVLGNSYRGNLPAVEETVRGVLMNATVTCPALGELPMHECGMWRTRARTFSGHNALRVQMYRACARCPRNRREGEP